MCPARPAEHPGHRPARLARLTLPSSEIILQHKLHNTGNRPPYLFGVLRTRSERAEQRLSTCRPAAYRPQATLATGWAAWECPIKRGKMRYGPPNTQLPVETGNWVQRPRTPILPKGRERTTPLLARHTVARQRPATGSGDTAAPSPPPPGPRHPPRPPTGSAPAAEAAKEEHASSQSKNPQSHMASAECQSPSTVRTVQGWPANPGPAPSSPPPASGPPSNPPPRAKPPPASGPPPNPPPP